MRQHGLGAETGVAGVAEQEQQPSQPDLVLGPHLDLEVVDAHTARPARRQQPPAAPLRARPRPGRSAAQGAGLLVDQLDEAASRSSSSSTISAGGSFDPAHQPFGWHRAAFSVHWLATRFQIVGVSRFVHSEPERLARPNLVDLRRVSRP